MQSITVKRFWYRYNDPFDLTSEGFLVDPTSRYGAYVGSQALTLESLRELPLLVLVGEPGIGKSTELRPFMSASATRKICFINLATVDSETSLRSKLDKDPALKIWMENGGTLELFLDSFDEMPARNPTSILLDVLQDYRSVSREAETVEEESVETSPESSEEANVNLRREVKRPKRLLCFRIACRMGQYQGALGEGLREIVGGEEETPYVYKLAPIREEDALALVAEQGADSKEIFDQVRAIGMGPLMAKPFHLNLLLSGLRRDASPIRSLGELYERGIRGYCEETSESRRANRLPPPDVNRRMQTGRQAGAMSILCGRSEIWLGRESETPEGNLLNVGELTQGEVTSEAAYDLGDTALLVPAGENRFGWSHKTVAEYLASRYLIEADLSLSQLQNLLVDPASKRIFPQCRETSAWVASDHRAFRDWMIQAEPETVLTSDVALFSDEDKTAVVESLLDTVDQERIYNVAGDAENNYPRLNHPGLMDALVPYITDRGKNIFVRRAAIEIAQACKIEALETILADLALDPEEEGPIREAAARAVVRYGSENSRYRLKPLALGTTGGDSQDQLRGYGFRACWPDGLTVEEAFNALQPPKEDIFIGSYSVFLDQEFRKGFRQEHLVPALVWLLKQEAPKNRRWDRTGPGPFIMAEAWRNMNDPQVLDLLARVVLRRGKNFQNAFEFEDRTWSKGLLSPEEFLADVAQRRTLFEAAVLRPCGTTDRLRGLLHSRPPIITKEDVGWFWEKTRAASAEERTAWLRAANMIPDNLEAMYEAYCALPEARERYAYLFDAVPIEGERADEMRDDWNATQERQQKLKPKKPDFDVSENLNRHFDNADEDVSLLWLLHLDLIVDESNRGDQASWFNPDVTTLPGWPLLSEDRRERWTAVSRAYLESTSAREEVWTPNTVFHPDVAGYRSLRWMLEYDAEWLAGQDTAFYERWGSAVASMANHQLGEVAALDLRLLSLFYLRTPERIEAVVRRIIEHEARTATYPFFYNRFEKIWDERLSAVAMDALIGGVRHRAFGDEVLARLVKVNYAPAMDYAWQILRDRRGRKTHNRLRHRGAALALLQRPEETWASLFPMLWENRVLARDVLPDFVRSPRDDSTTSLGAAVGATAMGRLYELLLDLLPLREDPVFRSGGVSREQGARFFRDDIPRYLATVGNQESVTTLADLYKKHPDLPVINNYRIGAEALLRQNKWKPITPGDLVRLVQSRRGRRVESANQLLEIVVETLDQIGESLLDSGGARLFWYPDEVSRNKAKARSKSKSNRADDEIKGETFWKPTDENTFSTNLGERLRERLSEQGIVINREVEVRPGEETDLHVVAMSREKNEEVQFTVIVEVKGCWHRELGSAMETQLVQRYLGVPGRSHGVYLVGWFDCDAWSKADYRQGDCRRNRERMEQGELESQAVRLSTGGKTVRYLGMNCRLPEQATRSR